MDGVNKQTAADVPKQNPGEKSTKTSLSFEKAQSSAFGIRQVSIEPMVNNSTQTGRDKAFEKYQDSHAMGELDFSDISNGKIYGRAAGGVISVDLKYCDETDLGSKALPDFTIRFYPTEKMSVKGNYDQCGTKSLSHWQFSGDLSGECSERTGVALDSQKSVDSDYYRYVDNHLSGSERVLQVSEDEILSQDDAGGIDSTLVAMAAADSESDVSPDRRSLSSTSNSTVSENPSFTSSSGSLIEFNNSKQIKIIADYIKNNGDSKDSRKTSDIILKTLITYKLENVPASISDEYTGMAPGTIRRFMFQQCALQSGWGSTNAKQTEELYPVFVDPLKSTLFLHPELIDNITNDYYAFERIAEVRQYRAGLLQSINDRFAKKIKDIDSKKLFQYLSFVKIKGGKSRREIKEYFQDNLSKLTNQCDFACYQFIISFCSHLDAADDLSKDACKYISARKIEIIAAPGEQKERKKLITRYSRDLLKACTKLRLGVDLVERKLIPTGLEAFQERYKNEVKLPADTNYSGIIESDREAMMNLLTIMDGLETEANNLVTSMESEINRLPRGNSEGKRFEERVLELKKVDGYYVMKTFEPLRGIFNRILDNTDHSSGQAIILGDGSTSSQFSVS